ncbi:MAG: hypothetical protein IJV45_10740 [Prevotella sp.]|nr:hypothetical protein [Prevotella sp.]
MRTTVKHFRMLVAAMAMGAVVAACTDDDKYSINEARLDGNTTVLGQMEAYSYATPFNLVTDADAEWTATIEWDEEAFNQPAYVYPKKGIGPATLKVVMLDNPTQSPRQATLKITFPKDESKNIAQTITQKRGSDTNDSEEIAFGNKARGIGYGYNIFNGYAGSECMITPILAVDEMYDEKELVYDFNTLKVETREESGASVEEMARKLNASMHAGASGWGLSVSVDAKFNSGQKNTASNEFAWMDVNATTCTASFNKPLDDVILERMTDEAYNDINGIPRTVRNKVRLKYPTTDEGFAEMVKNYGTHLVVGGQLGGQLHTQVTANTSKITTAYNASVALEVTYSGPFSSDLSSNTKAQWAHAQSKNQNAFYFAYELRGGSKDDGSFEALNSVLSTMTKARQGAGTTDDLVDDSELNVQIDDNATEYQAAADAWIRSMTPTGTSASEREDALKNVVLVDFQREDNLVPLYELIDRDLTLEEDGVDGEARYQAFKDWYERKLMPDPSIIDKYKPKSQIDIAPTIIDPIVDLTNANTTESLIQDIFLSNGTHVARVCSEFIPLINSSKRVNVIYPVVNGKPRYNLGIFCGDEDSYAYYVSWGQVDDPTTPLITQIKGSRLGGYNVAYLRGNHLTLEPDENFSENEYLRTAPKPYTLIMSDNGEQIEYPLVKINDYIYTRNLYRARAYQNGTPQMSDKVPYDWDHQNAFSVFSRYTDATQNVDWYMVSNYTNSLNRWGGFAPQGWTVPYASQYQKMIDNIAGIATNKPDGTIGASFLKGGVYGLNTKATGFIGVGFLTDSHGYFDAVSLNNKEVLYLGAIADADREKLDGTGNVYGKRHELESQFRCDALAVRPSEGSAAMTWFLDQSIVLLDNEKITDTSIWPESVRNKDNWKNHHGSVIGTVNYVYYDKNTKYDMPAQKVCFPVIICQRVIK